MIVTQGMAAKLQRFSEKRLGVRGLSLQAVQNGQVANRFNCLGIIVSKNLPLQCQHFALEGLCLRKIALKIIEHSQVIVEITILRVY